MRNKKMKILFSFFDLPIALPIDSEKKVAVEEKCPFAISDELGK